jgi:hypothetical protein
VLLPPLDEHEVVVTHSPPRVPTRQVWTAMVDSAVMATRTRERAAENFMIEEVRVLCVIELSAVGW